MDSFESLHSTSHRTTALGIGLKVAVELESPSDADLESPSDADLVSQSFSEFLQSFSKLIFFSQSFSEWCVSCSTLCASTSACPDVLGCVDAAAGCVDAAAGYVDTAATGGECTTLAIPTLATPTPAIPPPTLSRVQLALERTSSRLHTARTCMTTAASAADGALISMEKAFETCSASAVA